MTKYPRKPTAKPRAGTAPKRRPPRREGAPAPSGSASGPTTMDLDEIVRAIDQLGTGDEIAVSLDDLDDSEPRTTTRAAAPRAISVAEDQLLEVSELDAAGAPEPTATIDTGIAAPLRIAVYEDPTALATAQSAIATAGHETALGASGPDGLERLRAVLAEDAGELDALLVALPGGEPLIAAARALAPRRPVVIASVAGSAVVAARRAVEAGADLVATRPHDSERLAPVLLAAARLAEERASASSARGSEQLMRARLDALIEPEPGSLQPFELFQRVLELELKRARRYGYALSVALFAVELAPPPPPPGVRGILRARAGTALIHAIRDIDMATALPPDLSRAFDAGGGAGEERFLVLLPYTELGGAALVARRVIAAVAEGDPVVAAGRTFAPRFIGAVAGAAPGQPLSFSRLMKDATRALASARRDGAELAVPMPMPVAPGGS